MLSHLRLVTTRFKSCHSSCFDGLGGPRLDPFPSLKCCVFGVQKPRIEARTCTSADLWTGASVAVLRITHCFKWEGMRPGHRSAAGPRGKGWDRRAKPRHACVFGNVQRNLSGGGESAPPRGFAICAAAIRSNWCRDLICWLVTRGQLVSENTSKLQISMLNVHHKWRRSACSSSTGGKNNTPLYSNITK